jgi:hypothetical protein
MEQVEQTMFDQIADEWLRIAKSNRARYKYSEDERFVQCAGIIAGDGEISMIPLLWRDNKEKYRRMLALSLTAKAANAVAIVMVADSRWTQSPELCEYFKIPTPLEVGIEEFQRLYMEILKRYGGEIRKLPRQLWKEAVMVCLKGPGLTPRIRMAEYVEGRRDTVEWISTLGNGYDKANINMLPDWWTVQ